MSPARSANTFQIHVGEERSDDSAYYYYHHPLPPDGQNAGTRTSSNIIIMIISDSELNINTEELQSVRFLSPFLSCTLLLPSFRTHS